MRNPCCRTPCRTVPIILRENKHSPWRFIANGVPPGKLASTSFAGMELMPHSSTWSIRGSMHAAHMGTASKARAQLHRNGRYSNAAVLEPKSSCTAVRSMPLATKLVRTKRIQFFAPLMGHSLECVTFVECYACLLSAKFLKPCKSTDNWEK